ncbi:LOW QUALITY PROTEIN: spermatogenesis-associated protein 31D3-like [Glossophaga mutica]
MQCQPDFQQHVLCKFRDSVQPSIAMGVGCHRNGDVNEGPGASRSSFPCSGPGCSFVPPVSCSPLGQHHDSTRFHQLLCPDPSCELCNNATAEMDQLLFSLALEEAAFSVLRLASITPETEPLFTESPAFSAVPPGYLIPLPLPEPFPPCPSILPANPMTPLGDFPSPSLSVHSLPPAPFPSLESEIPVNRSTPQTLDFPSMLPHDSQSVETPLTLNTIFLDSSITQDISPTPDLAQTVNPTGSVTCHHVPPTLSFSPPPDCTVTVTRPKSIFISSKPVLENSPQASAHALSTHVLKGTDHPRLSTSDFSSQKAHAKDSLPSACSSDKDVEYDSEKDLCSSMMSLLGPGCSFVPPVPFSPPGQHHDTIRFRQLLCPDPSCEVCNNATAEVNRLLFPEALEDATTWASTAPGLSETRKPIDSFGCQHVPSVPSVSTPPDCPSTVTQSKSIFTSLKPVAEDSSPGSPGSLSNHKKESEEGPFSTQMWSEYQRTSSGNSLQPPDTQDATVPQTGWNIRDKPQQLRNSQQLFYVKTLGKNLQQKYSQLFWGLPSLHSESLVAALLVSRSSSPLETRFVLFNGICNASTVKMQQQESPPLPHFHLLPLLNVDSQHLPQIKPQAQSFTQVQHQPHFQSQLPIQSSSSPFQIRDCEESFHRPQNESDSNILNENQHLECCTLQKQQESLQNLVPVHQKSQEVTCLRAPNLPLVSQSSHADAPASILPGHFCITNEPQEKLQLYAPRRLIPPWCPHACRNVESLALMAPQCKLTETSQQKGSHAHLQFSDLQGQCSKSLGMGELSFPGSFCEGNPHKCQLREDVKRNLGYILEKSPEDSLQMVSECYLVKGLRVALDIKSNCVCHSRSHLGNELINVLRKDIDQNQMKIILRLHLRKKSWQITEGRIPIDVCRSWLAEDNTLLSSGGSLTNMENTNSKTTMIGRVCCQITTLELSFLDSSTRQILEAHIIRFRVSQRWGLPLKVVESIKLYTLREAKTWPFPQFPSSGTHISAVVAKAEVPKPLEGSSKTFQGNNLRTINSVSILDCPLDSSYVHSERQRVLKTSHTDMEHKVAENVQTTVHGRQTFQLLTHSTIDKRSQSETLLYNRCSPEMPRKQAGAGHEPRYENMDSIDRAEMIQSQKTVEKNLEHSSTSSMFREIFKAQELHALKSPSCDILTAQEFGGSQMINVNMSKEESTLTTECPSSKISGSQDSKISNPKKQVLGEFTSDSLLCMSSLTPSQSISNGDMGTSQGPHVHFEDSGISPELTQESQVSKHVLWKCQDNHFPPTEKELRTLGSKAKECGNEDSSVRTSKAGKKNRPIKNRELEGTFTSLPQDEQFPPDSYFRKKMRQFFQWINPKRKIKGLETPQQNAKFMSTFAQKHDPAESADIFLSCELPEAHELMTTIGKILEKKLACSHELEALKLSQEKELQTEEPDKGHPSNSFVLHPRPISICQLCPVPPVPLTPYEDSVFRNLTLLFKQNSSLEVLDFWSLGLLMPSMFPDPNRSCEVPVVQSCADSHVTGAFSWGSQDRDGVHAVPGLK